MRAFALISALCVLVACSNTEKAVPRRPAYHRITTYDTIYNPPASLPVSIDINSALNPDIEVRADGAFWLTAPYPAYNATLLLTFTPVTEATVESVVDNRAERIHLNIGSGNAQVEETDNAYGYHSNIVMSTASTTTPLQFLAVNPENPHWVVSGSVYFHDASPTVSIDSISPVYDALLSDLRRAMLSLRNK